MARLAGFIAASGVALMAASAAHAGGFYLQEQGVRGTGRAYSGEVADTGVESLWWNPASIADSGTEVYAGANAIFVPGSVTDRGSTITFPGGLTIPSGGSPRATNPIENGVAPNLGGALRLNDRFTIGFSTAAPFNLTTAYIPNSWTRYDALKSRIFTADGQGTVAMRATPWLDLGVGVDLQYIAARLTNALPNLVPGAPDGLQGLSGHGWDWGWTAGAQAHFGRLSLGASYRSSIRHDLKGTAAVVGLVGPLAGANFVGPGGAAFSTPWIATFGARYRVTDQLTLDAQVQRFGWSEFGAINVNSLGGPQVVPENYRDTTSGGAGLDYALSPKLTLRTGFQYDPTPTASTGPDARVPDGNRWLFAAGASAKVSRQITIDAAFAYIDFQSSTISRTAAFYTGTPAATVAQLTGEAEGAGYVLSLGARMAW